MGLFGNRNNEVQEQEPQEDASMYMPQDMGQAPPMISVPYNMMGREKADLMEKIKPEHTIEAIRYKLMGYEQNPESKVWTKVPYLQAFAISERGAWELTNLIFSVSNQNISISNLNEEQIKASALDIMNASIVMMLDYWYEYRINSTSQIRYLSTIIFRTAYITLHQPLNKGIQQLIMGTQTETRSVIDTPMQKRGFLSAVFGNKR
jgi:hypothetical protein